MIDVTVMLSPSTPIWPGEPRLELTQKTTDLGGGEEATSSTFTMIPHCGTHIDAPLHFAKGGQAVDALPIDLLIGPCLVLEYTGDNHIGIEVLDLSDVAPGKYSLIALPIKLEGVEGAPARVVLLQSKDVGNVLNAG